MRQPEFLNAVLCDDIREESNGKFVLVGVTSGVVSIIVRENKIPSQRLSVYAEVLVDAPTKVSLKFKHENDDGGLFEVSGKLVVETTEVYTQVFGDTMSATPIPFRNKRVDFRKSGLYQLFGSFDDGEWIKLNELLVALEDANGKPFTPATP